MEQLGVSSPHWFGAGHGLENRLVLHLPGVDGAARDRRMDVVAAPAARIARVAAFKGRETSARRDLTDRRLWPGVADVRSQRVGNCACARVCAFDSRSLVVGGWGRM